MLKNQAKNLIIIDFDDTLFDRKGKFSAAAFNTGVDLSSENELYKKVKLENNGIYDFKKHIKLIANNDSKKLQKLEQSMEKVFQRSFEFLFPDAHEVLQNLRQQADKLILASRGKVYFQKKKIYNSGIEKYFDEIIISEKYKAEFLADRIKSWRAQNHEIIFIDDSEKEIRLIKKQFPYIETVLIQGSDNLQHRISNLFPS